jgi:hypothetical protein
MHFTDEQYDEAIELLKAAKRANHQASNGCLVCGGACLPHQCGHNPLYAMHQCEVIAQRSKELHHALHVLAGAQTHMGEPVGPNEIVVPSGKPKKE